MSRIDKLKQRLSTTPKDFTWDELVKVLNSYGYYQINPGKTGGSRRKFVDERKDIISLHEPHPEKVVKKYALEEVIEKLQRKEEETGKAVTPKASEIRTAAEEKKSDKKKKG